MGDHGRISHTPDPPLPVSVGLKEVEQIDGQAEVWKEKTSGLLTSIEGGLMNVPQALIHLILNLLFMNKISCC